MSKDPENTPIDQSLRGVVDRIIRREREEIAFRLSMGEVVVKDRGMGILDVYATTQEQADEAARELEQS